MSTKRFLPGHGNPKKTQSSTNSLPGVNRKKQQARRAVWTYNHARRFDQTEVSSRFKLAIAVAIMLVGMLAALSGTNPLERAHETQAKADAAQTVQVETPSNA